MKVRNSLIIGKFYPFHLGHQYLMDTAISESKSVTILVCSLNSESIPGYLRYKWVSEHYKNNNKVKVYWVNEHLPQSPEEHPDFWDIWNSIALRYCPKVTHIYSSENYGETWANKLGINFRTVDIDRTTYPVSGTRCRESYINQWGLLNSETQKDIGLKFCFVGAESTGKSTISKQIAEKLNLPWVREYGREYCDPLIERDGLANFKLTKMDFANIMINQEKLIRTKDKFKILDTDLVSTCMWQKLMLGEINSELLNKTIDQYNTQYIIINYKNIEWEDDGTRRDEEMREWQQNWTKDFLIKYNKPFVQFNDANNIESYIIRKINEQV